MNPSHGDAAQHDVVDVLVTQHRRIEQLLGQVVALEGFEKADAFLALATLLDRHENAEQQVVHPMAHEDIGDYSRLTSELVGEENRADDALAELRELGVDDARFVKRFDAFRESLLAHVAREEAGEFSRLRAAVPRATLVRMADEVAAAQAAMARAR